MWVEMRTLAWHAYYIQRQKTIVVNEDNRFYQFIAWTGDPGEARELFGHSAITSLTDDLKSWIDAMRSPILCVTFHSIPRFLNCNGNGRKKNLWHSFIKFQFA
jgi:hypothetical protein